MKTIHMLYGRDGMDLSVPDSADVLTGQHVPAVARLERFTDGACPVPGP